MVDSNPAQEFMELYRSIYKYLHVVRDKNEHYPSAEALAVMGHLILSGPLTVSEAAKHFKRAQSAMSELIDRLQANGYLDRVQDSRDKRRTLIWLTPAGHRAYEQVQEVLDRKLLTDSLNRLSDKDRNNLLQGLQALVSASQSVVSNKRKEHEHKK
jgi:DNA-binding MarR family transcriptional regulator